MTTYSLECAAPACGRRFAASHPSARTCSDACRQRFYRERKAIHAAAAVTLLRRQTAAVVAMTDPSASDAERAHYRSELDSIAAEAARLLPGAA